MVPRVAFVVGWRRLVLFLECRIEAAVCGEVERTLARSQNVDRLVELPPGTEAILEPDRVILRCRRNPVLRHERACAISQRRSVFYVDLVEAVGRIRYLVVNVAVRFGAFHVRRDLSGCHVLEDGGDTPR